MTDALAILATSWGLVMAVAPLIQIRRIVVRRSSADISIGYLWVLVVGFIIWIWYGASIGSLPLMIPNAMALLMTVAMIVVAWRYREGTPP